MGSGLVSIVVLNWNTLEDTKKCLEAIRALKYNNYEIILVDNGSEDGSKEYFSKADGFKYIDLPANLGFAGGQIAALAVSAGEYIALVNSDAYVDPDWLGELVDAMEKASVAAVGGRAYLLDEDHKLHDQSSPFYSYQVIDLRKGYAQTLTVGEKLVPVNSISGAGVLIRRSAIEQVGYFDERFFAYYEETDLFARFKRFGFEILYVPSALTWHKIRGSSSKDPSFYLYLMHRNRFLYSYKNFDTHYLLPFIYSYAKDFLRSQLRANQSLDDKARVRAFWWNLLHIIPTTLARKRVLRLGPAYSTLLLGDASQTVSIVITCYNYESFVGEAIRSALAQTQPVLEVIVINDGSTDDSLSVIMQYQDRVRIINQENQGIIKTKNRALHEVSGEWVIFLDADDHIDKHYIEKTLASARQDNSDLVYTDMHLFGAKNEHFKSIKFNRWVLYRNNFIHNSALMRVALLRAVGGYKLEMKDGYEDWELYLTLNEAGMKASHVPEPLLYYRQHPQSSRNTLAFDKAAEIYTRVYELHPSLSQWSSGRLLWSMKQLYRRAISRLVHGILGKFFITRKLVGLLRLVKHGNYPLILKKTLNHLNRFIRR